MKLLKLETAIASCLRDIKPKKKINIPLASACGHVIAENLCSRRDSPHPTYPQWMVMLLCMM